MIPTDLNLAGSIAKTHGIDGTVLLRLEDSFENELFEGDYVFVSIDNTLIPFAISSVRMSGSNAFVRFFEFSTAEDAAILKTRKVYCYTGQKNTSIDPNAMEGCILEDLHSGFKAKIIEFLDNPGNPLLRVADGETEYLIPFHEDLIDNWDKDKGVLMMKLPEGLL